MKFLSEHLSLWSVAPTGGTFRLGDVRDVNALCDSVFPWTSLHRNTYIRCVSESLEQTYHFLSLTRPPGRTRHNDAACAKGPAIANPAC